MGKVIANKNNTFQLIKSSNKFRAITKSIMLPREKNTSHSAIRHPAYSGTELRKKYKSDEHFLESKRL